MSLITVTEKNFKEVISTGTALIDFWADWCGPCKLLGPVIEELADDFSGKAAVGKVNTDDCGELASEYGITAIPTVILFKDGAEVQRFVGVRPKEEYAEAMA